MQTQTQIRLENDQRRSEAHAPTLRVVIPDGEIVEVRNRFENHWVHGFAVAESGDDGYRLRRLSDGRVLPTWFAADAVRRRT